MSSYSSAGPSRHHPRGGRGGYASEEGEISDTPNRVRSPPRRASPKKWKNPLADHSESGDEEYGPPKPATAARKGSAGAGSGSREQTGLRRESSWSPAKDAGLPAKPRTPRLASSNSNAAKREETEGKLPPRPRQSSPGRRRSPGRERERERVEYRDTDYRDREYRDERRGEGRYGDYDAYRPDERYRDEDRYGGRRDERRGNGRYDDLESYWRHDRIGGGGSGHDRYEPPYDRPGGGRDRYRDYDYDDRGRYDDYRDRQYDDRPRDRERERDRYGDGRRRDKSPSAEEGEVEETPVQSPPPRHTPSRGDGVPAEGSYRPKLIKNRPTNRSRSDLRPPTPPPPTSPSVDEPILTPPLDDLPPPPAAPPPPRPPSSTPPPAPPAPDDPSHHDPDGDIPRPRHRALAATKSAASLEGQSGEREKLPPVPAAPNRNELQPSTRVSTPLGKTSSGSFARTPKTFKLWTAAEEVDALKTTFAGVTTLDSYDITRKLGEGTFGVVTMAKERATGVMVALKKLITHNPRDGVSVTTAREIKILKSLDHPNVVPIRDMIVHRERMLDKSERGQVFMVFPYMDHDLCGLLGNRDFKMGQGLAKLLFKQILEGMTYIHANNLIHRDIKTANILVDRAGRVMIADFGLARSRTVEGTMPPHMETEYTNMVVTRWYRAPELLLGDTRYGPAVDMWSLGCVLGEMYHKNPILAGESDRDQLSKICAKCGPLNQDTFPGWDTLPGFVDAPSFPWDKTPAETPLFELSKGWGMDRGGVDLMMNLLTLNPKKRLTAEEALDHRWFWIDPPINHIKDDLITVESSHEMTTRRPEPPPQPAPVRPPPVAVHQGPRHHSGPAGYHRGPPREDFRNARAPPPHMGGPPMPGLAAPGHYPTRPGVNPYAHGMANGGPSNPYGGGVGPGPAYGPPNGGAGGPISYPLRPGDNPYGGPPGLPSRPPAAAGLPPPPFGLAGSHANGVPAAPFGLRGAPPAAPGGGGGGFMNGRVPSGAPGMNLNGGGGNNYPPGPMSMAQKRGPPNGPGGGEDGLPKRPRNEYDAPRGPRADAGSGGGGLPY